MYIGLFHVQHGEGMKEAVVTAAARQGSVSTEHFPPDAVLIEPGA